MPSVERPLSPHIGIYRPQLTSLLSISNRITGIALSAGVVLFVAQLLAAVTGPAAFERFQGWMGSWFGLFVLFAWSFAFFFHLTNGVRHLAWDAGYGYSLPAAYRSGALVLLATVLLTAFAWVLAMLVWR